MDEMDEIYNLEVPINEVSNPIRVDRDENTVKAYYLDLKKGREKLLVEIDLKNHYAICQFFSVIFYQIQKTQYR